MKFTLYHILCIFRAILVFLPQTGYIHPDEYFQGPEIVYGDMLEWKVYRPWEFTCLNPIRCIVFPYFFTGICSVLVNFLKNTLFYQTESFSYFVVLLPRVVMCCFSYLHDFYLYKMCIMMKLNYKLCLNLFASSYVTLVYFTRTFSNSLEALFFTHMLLLLTQFICMEKSSTLFESCKFDSRQSLFISFMLGINLSFGCFNRPTFIFFALYPCFVWMYFLYSINLNLKYKFNIVVSLFLGILCSSFSLTVIDTFYYNKVHYSTIISHERWRVISTPMNFLLYNTNMQNLNVHGLHPRWLHIFVNIPILFSIYGIFLVIFSLKNFRKMHKNVFNYLAFLVLSFLIPLTLLSLIPHQEPRFIIPLIIPLSLFCGNSLINKFVTHKFLVWFWCISNILGLVFYGFLHQAGVYLSLSYINTVLYKDTVIIFSKTYMPPRHLLAIPKNENSINVYDFAGSSEENLESGIIKIMKNIKPKNLFLIFPYEQSFIHFPVFTNSNYKFTNWKQFPHVSLENLPSFNKIRKCLVSNTSFINIGLSLQEMFSIQVVMLKNL